MPMQSLSPLFETRIKTIQELLQLSHLEVCLRPDWGSNSPQYREKIKQAIVEISKKMTSFVSSISHTIDIGGFILSQDKNIQLGFDIEISDRVEKETVRRVCKTDQELIQAPSADLLWAAKEASFKSLKGPNQLKVISAIEIQDWIKKNNFNEASDIYWSFSCKNVPVKGVVFHYESWVCAVSKN